MTNETTNAGSDDLARYARQSQFPGIGAEGQRRLAESRVLVCGCGALGSVLANTLARAGVGHLRIVDRDFLEFNNLQRQVIYDEDDVRSGLPKAVLAERRLRAINSQIAIEGIVADVDSGNIAELCDGVDAIVDGTDNFETRFLLNDASLKFGIPWVFGGCIGAEGQTMTILPGETACLHCLMIDGPPPPGTTATCDTAGILGPIINVVASFQACEALKILSGNREAVSRMLTVFEMWDNRVRQIKLDSLRNAVECPVCQRHEFAWLEGRRGSHSAVLCGRNAVQLSFPERQSIRLEELAARLGDVGHVTCNPFLLRLALPEHTLTVFADGRAIVGGTEDIAEARALYARYVGN
ncbi:MAG: ThiF family adenylyltransferase [Planctomycetales bacterium]|nr:ThiF family adenylyltransferase [Planctomycetales bacterium]MCA9207209.1 ThiF family adenylyltransferase [Planctomycetales bacterium]MCA9220307.1 ThiF family adenylyltransferase [Planctomycetales bacterium]